MFYLGKMIYFMVVYLDVVISLVVDFNGIYLMFGSKFEFFVLFINFIKELLFDNIFYLFFYRL